MSKSRKLTCGFPTSIATMIAACLTIVESLIFTIIYYYVFEDARAFYRKDNYKHLKRSIYMSIYISTLVLVSAYILTILFTSLLVIGQCKRKPSLLRTFLVFTTLKCMVVAAAGSVLIYIEIPRNEAIATVCVTVIHIYFALVVAKSRREMLRRTPAQQICMLSTLHPPAPTLFQPVTSQAIFAPSAPVIGDIPAVNNTEAPPAYYLTDHENYPPDYYAEYLHNPHPTNPEVAKF